MNYWEAVGIFAMGYIVRDFVVAFRRGGGVKISVGDISVEAENASIAEHLLVIAGTRK